MSRMYHLPCPSKRLSQPNLCTQSPRRSILEQYVSDKWVSQRFRKCEKLKSLDPTQEDLGLLYIKKSKGSPWQSCWQFIPFHENPNSTHSIYWLLWFIYSFHWLSTLPVECLELPKSWIQGWLHTGMQIHWFQSQGIWRWCRVSLILCIAMLVLSVWE